MTMAALSEQDQLDQRDKDLSVTNFLAGQGGKRNEIQTGDRPQNIRPNPARGDTAADTEFV
jgi:hypothetical protein